MIELKKHLAIGTFSLSFILALASCTKISDELALQKIKSAKEPSDIFQAICVGNKADTAQIRRLAMSLHWDEKPLSQEQKTNLLNGNWGASVNNTDVAVTTLHGFDPEVGHVVEGCLLSYTGLIEPAFVQNVVSKSGLQRVAPNNQKTKRPNDAIVLSDTGREEGSFVVLPFEIDFFGLRTVTAIAVMPSN
jgi:hypothetical protein